MIPQILMIFTVFYLSLGIFSNWFRFSLITAKLVRVKNVIRRNSIYPSTNNSDDEEEKISDLDIELDKKETINDRSISGETLEASSGDLDVAASPAVQEKVRSVDVTREVDENGQLVLSNTSSEAMHEGDVISNSESSGEVIGGIPKCKIILSGVHSDNANTKMHCSQIHRCAVFW